MSLHSIRYGGGEPTLVFLHGLGASEHDLYPLAAELIPGTYHFLQAPMIMDWGGYSWYDVDFDERGVRSYNAEQAVESRNKVISYLEGLGNPVILGGFSQGAILSTGVALARPDLVKGLVLWSGRLNQEFIPSPRPTLDLPVLQQHGTVDPVISISDGRELARFWSEVSSAHTYEEYGMGHGLIPASIAATRRWLLELE